MTASLEQLGRMQWDDQGLCAPENPFPGDESHFHQYTNFFLSPFLGKSDSLAISIRNILLRYF